MQRLRNGLAVAAVTLAIGSLAAGCGSGGVSNAVKSAASGVRSAASNPPSLTASPLPTQTSGPTISPTETVTVTITPGAPTTEAPATSQPSPTAATTAAAATSGSSLLWLWILLGALVLAGLVVWIARASGRRSAAAAGWRSTVADAYARGEALADAVRVADRPGAPGYTAAHWAGLQARADDLAQELYQLRQSARGQEDRMRVEDTLTSLRGLRAAMADEQAAGGAGGPGSPEAAHLHGWLMAFENALRALRAPYDQAPRI